MKEDPVPVQAYELVGPKVQGNPYGIAPLNRHRLWQHGANFERRGTPEPPRGFDAIRRFLVAYPQHEGIVWWHPDGRRAKIKRRDFGLEWPPKAPAVGGIS